MVTTSTIVDDPTGLTAPWLTEVHGVGDRDADRCWDDYRHGLFQGPLICILGDAFAAPTERGTRMFSAMPERSAAAIRDLDCFDILT